MLLVLSWMVSLQVRQRGEGERRSGGRVQEESVEEEEE
jgi:hypothetical protein